MQPFMTNCQTSALGYDCHVHVGITEIILSLGVSYRQFVYVILQLMFRIGILIQVKEARLQLFIVM